MRSLDLIEELCYHVFILLRGVFFTVEYQKLYTMLFNAITDAVDALEQTNFGVAKDILICAQQQAEEAYLCAEEE